MFALILHSDSTPMHIGSNSGWLMFAGMIMRPSATSLRTSSAEICSRSAMYAISSVTSPWRAKCIWLTLSSPVCAACSRRFTIHSERGLGTAAPLALPFPFECPLLLPLFAIGGDYRSLEYNEFIGSQQSFSIRNRHRGHPLVAHLSCVHRRTGVEELLRHHQRTARHGAQARCLFQTPARSRKRKAGFHRTARSRCRFHSGRARP